MFKEWHSVYQWFHFRKFGWVEQPWKHRYFMNIFHLLEHMATWRTPQFLFILFCERQRQKKGHIRYFRMENYQINLKVSLQSKQMHKYFPLCTGVNDEYSSSVDTWGSVSFGEQTPWQLMAWHKIWIHVLKPNMLTKSNYTSLGEGRLISERGDVIHKISLIKPAVSRSGFNHSFTQVIVMRNPGPARRGCSHLSQMWKSLPLLSNKDKLFVSLERKVDIQSQLFHYYVNSTLLSCRSWIRTSKSKLILLDDDAGSPYQFLCLFVVMQTLLGSLQTRSVKT